MSAPDTWAGLSSDEELAVTVAVMSALAAHRQAQVVQAVTGAGTFAVGVATDATPWGVTPASLTWWVLLAGFVLLSARAGPIAGAVSRMGNPFTDAWAWAHRTRPAGDASAGTWGLIPGSMGTRSYVVVGNGNPLSLNSAPRGAGREYSRSAASKTFTMDQLVARMEGIEWSRRPAFLDEIPDAYKPIDVIMAGAADLVEVRYELSQIVNVKGD
jgi:hypothetical protein